MIQKFFANNSSYDNLSEVLGILLIVALTLFFRLYGLENIPYGLNNDAAWEGSAALDMLNGNSKLYIPYADEGWRGEGMVRLITSFFIYFLGNDQIAIRLATTIFGILLPISVYFLIKVLFNKKIALITALLIASSGWHIVMSRSGWRAISLPLFASLSLLFLYKGFKFQKTKDFVLSGIFLSIASLYTYDAGRAFPIIYLFALVILFADQKIYFKKYLTKIVISGLACLLISIPMLAYASQHWENFIGRSKFLYEHNIQNPEDGNKIINNIKTSMLIFNKNANGNDFFINDPLVDKPVSYLMILGLAVALYKVVVNKSREYLLILVWFLLSLLPGILSAPNGNRAIGAIPSVYFLGGVGIVSVEQLIKKLTLSKRLFFPIAVTAYLIGLSAVVTFREYLGPHKREIPGLYPETKVASDHAKTLWKNYDLYFTDNYPRELLTFYLYKKESGAFDKNYTWLESSVEFLNVLNEDKNKSKGKAFIMFANPTNEEIAKNIAGDFPQSKTYHLKYVNGEINRSAALVVLVPHQ